MVVGVMGIMGNKGGVVTRFQLYQMSFFFLCTHLAAHQNNVNGRNNDYANILNKIEFQSNVNPEQPFQVIDSYHILDHDYVFWIGDLNYRIATEISLEQCFAYIAVKEVAFLAPNDRLNIERRA